MEVNDRDSFAADDGLETLRVRPKACVYLRVSTDDQADHGTSLDSQEAACLTLCEQEGFIVPEPYRIREQSSGATLRRTGLSKLRELARSGAVQAVCYFVPDRLSRDPVDLIVLLREFEQAGVRVLAVHNPPSHDPLGRALQFLAGTFGEVERRAIVERTMRGKKEAAKGGRMPSGFGRYGGPYGLRWDRGAKRLRWLVDGPRSVVEGILRDCLGGQSINMITLRLNGEEIPASAGGFWHRSAVHRVLSHARMYAGEGRWSGIPIPNRVDNPVITLDEAEAIAEQLRMNQERSVGYGRR